jgi:molybdopterin-guanine dinucleotide biosynthesis protein MobB
MRISVLTLSDRSARGERADASAPALIEWLAEKGYAVVGSEIIPDDTTAIVDKLSSWADSGLYDLILTTGGTGVAPRDVTPDATMQVLDKVIPGIGEVMRSRSLLKTPNAMLSRAVAGIRSGCLIINLPGSPKGAVECLEAVWDAVPHGVAKIQGDPSDCVPMPARSAKLPVPAVSFVAKSGTGKTTLLEQVISELKKRGWRLGVIKHDAHKFEIDHPGKDSYRFTAAGADTMLISSPAKLATVKQHAQSPPIEELIATYFADVDIVLTEGFKKSGLPKIEVHRAECGNTLLCRGETHDPALLAVASDEPLQLDVPVLDLNNPSAVALFVEQRFLGRSK